VFVHPEWMEQLRSNRENGQRRTQSAILQRCEAKVCKVRKAKFRVALFCFSDFATFSICRFLLFPFFGSARSLPRLVG
jgi:hypothetical protein